MSKKKKKKKKKKKVLYTITIPVLSFYSSSAWFYHFRDLRFSRLEAILSDQKMKVK